MKKISMGPKPQPVSADDWVLGRAESAVTVNETRAAEKAETQKKVEETALVATTKTVSPEEQGTDTDAPVVLKRLTLDIPEELHARIKSQCALRRVKMVDAIRDILDESFSI